MNISDIKPGKVYQYFYDGEAGQLLHKPVLVKSKSARRVFVTDPENKRRGFNVSPKALTDAQVEAF